MCLGLDRSWHLWIWTLVIENFYPSMGISYCWLLQETSQMNPWPFHHISTPILLGRTLLGFTLVSAEELETRFLLSWSRAFLNAHFHAPLRAWEPVCGRLSVTEVPVSHSGHALFSGPSLDSTDSPRPSVSCPQNEMIVLWGWPVCCSSVSALL